MEKKVRNCKRGYALIKLKTCPNCKSTTEGSHIEMFKGQVDDVRDHGDWIECRKCGYEGKPLEELPPEEQVHNIHVRNLPHNVYERLYNLRKYHKAKSWAELLDKVTEEYVKQIEEYEWI